MRAFAPGASDALQPFGILLIDTGFNDKSHGLLAPGSPKGSGWTQWGFLPGGEFEKIA